MKHYRKKLEKWDHLPKVCGCRNCIASTGYLCVKNRVKEFQNVLRHCTTVQYSTLVKSFYVYGSFTINSNRSATPFNGGREGGEDDVVLHDGECNVRTCRCRTLVAFFAPWPLLLFLTLLLLLLLLLLCFLEGDILKGTFTHREDYHWVGEGRIEPLQNKKQEIEIIVYLDCSLWMRAV